MDFASIRHRLKPCNGTTWRAVLDDDAALLMDCPIAIEIETRTFPDDSPIPAISDVESGLIDAILARLPDCITECERLLDNDPTIGHIRVDGGAKVVNPHIWISREVMQQDGDDRWVMVLGVDVNPDFGWHIEFEGLTALGIWAGD
jgi:hypothetical protein